MTHSEHRASDAPFSFRFTSRAKWGMLDDVQRGRMHPNPNHSEIFTLPVEQRLDLVQRLWDSVRDEIEAMPLTPTQRTEVARRIAEIDSGAVHCEPFDAVIKRLLPG